MSKRCGGYFIRFIILHVLTYTVIGVIFFQLQDYERAFKVQEYFELFRPLDHPLVMYSMFIQILRGAILVALLYPFHNSFMKEKRGWLLLFTILFGLTAFGSLVSIPNFIERITEVSFFQAVLENTVGLPEIIVQILLFSCLFIRWEKKRNKNYYKRGVL